MRRQCLILAENTNTPVGWWLAQPLGELVEWIGAYNEIARERKEARNRQ